MATKKAAKSAKPGKAKTAAKRAPAKKAARVKASRVKASTKKVAAKTSAPKKPSTRRPAKGGSKQELAPKKATKPLARAKPKPAVITRRDGSGHLDPAYAKDLRTLSRNGTIRDDDRGFFANRSRSKDSLAEQRGEEFVETVTSGEDEGEDVLDRHVVEEEGGPFVLTSGDTEFARGTDASNPKGATREPFPTT